ncbi:hypothetical protein Vafri_11098 [Volvox africanus]|uniref:Protein kinase domain-containing protein n=1 Tax=Volvox africanus TaxID=51714 RepID=A0A8J4F303_9CHLO|nr:hypothetical protein Vafri_11098 [Volvox africanus]
MIADIITAISVVFFLLPNLTAGHSCNSRACKYESNMQLSMASHKGPGRELVVAIDSTAGRRNCANGLQFATAVADQSVEEVFITSDITLKESDWSNVSLPFRLMRNVTVRGFNENRDSWFVLDINYVKNKIQLGAGVALVFRFLVINHWREDPQFMVPGLDLVAPGPIPERTDGLYWPAVMAENAALIQRTCAPTSDPLSTTAEHRIMERPAAFPGNQTSRFNVSQPGCLSSQSSNNNGLLRPTRCCWPMAGVRQDFATFALNLEQTGRTTLAGYLVFMRDSDYFCETLMPERCAKEYTPAGCYWRMFPKNVRGGSIPVPSPSAEDDHKTSSSSLKGAVLGGALGGAIGLCIVVLVGAAVVIVIMHRRGYQRRQPQQLLEGAPLYSVKYYYYYCCCCCNLSDIVGGNMAATDSIIDDPEDGGKRPIDWSDDSHGRLLTDRGQQAAEIALHLEDGSSLLADLQRRHSDGPWVTVLPLQQASNQSGDFLTDPLCLVPITSLTPLHPAINLNVKLDGSEVTLSGVTLGKGGFGRVVKGMYGGIPVAVKLIDDGLWHQPAAIKQYPSVGAVPQAALYKSAPIVSVSHAAADNKKVRCSDDTQVVMGGIRSSIRQQQAAVITSSRAGASPPQQFGSAERAPSRAGDNDDCLTAAVRTDNTKHAAAASSMKRHGVAASIIVGGLVRGSCDNNNGSLPICSSKAVITSSEGAVAASSRKPAAMDIVDMMKSSAIMIPVGERGDEKDTCDQPTSNSSHYTSYAGDYFEVYSAAVAARSTLIERHERIDSIVAPADDDERMPPAKKSLEATLKQEVEVLARCQHPNIVRLLAASLQAPRFCLVMELMETSLDRLLYAKRGTRRLLPLDMVLHVSDQIARGLAYLHPTIMHRDLKPANVLISNAGSSCPVAKLADFGLSRIRNTVLITKNPEVGTAPYVAPEVFDVQNFVITDRVDVYAFGIILWEMLAGRRPWEGHNHVIIAVLVAMHKRRPPLGLLSDERCPPKLRSLIHACWDPDPARRPAAAEIVKALALVQEALLHTSTSSTMEISTRQFLSVC